MRPLLLALLLSLGSFAAYGQAPDCQFTQTFTTTGYGVTVSNQAVANLGTQCVTWRLSYYADNMTALSIQVEGAPDSAGAPGTFAAVPTTACSSTQQPPCTLDGANPLTDANHATVAFRGYYAWMALNVTVFTPTGSPAKITARMYGYKGTSPAAGNKGGSGSGNATTINGGSVPASARVLGTNASSQLIVATATDLSALDYVAGGGTAQVQTVTLSPAVTALTNGLQICWLPIAANTGAAPTLAVNATAAKPITKLGATALVTNDLTTTAVACAIYDGTEFQLQNPQTAVSGGPYVPYTGATANVALGVHGITGAPFTGDSGSGGTTGLVPAPAAGDAAAGKYLAAGGGYGVPQGTGGAAYYQTVDNAGTPLTQRPTLNFTGSGVSCADNSGATRTDCTISGGSSGTGSTVFSSTTTAGPNNSAAETSVIGTVTGSKTIAANTFTNGAVLQAHAQGFYSLPAISDSLTLKMKCGSTVIGSAVFVSGSTVLTNGSWRFWLDITARGTGAGGAFITNGLVELTSGGVTDSTAQVLNTTTVAYDFTTACVFDITAQWGAAQSGETIQGTNVAAWFPAGSGNATSPVCTSAVIGYATVAALGGVAAGNVIVGSLPAQSKILMSTLREATQFVGTGITVLTVSLGQAGSETDYTAPKALLQTSGTMYDDSGAGNPNWASTTVVARFTSTGGNLSGMTDGSLYAAYCYVVLP